MQPLRTIPALTYIGFLLEEGFTLKEGDPFFRTYVRGQIVVCLDPEDPAMDLLFIKEDLDLQFLQKGIAPDRLWDRLLQHAREH